MNAVLPVAALLRDAVYWCFTGMFASAPTGTTFTVLYYFAQKNPQRVIILTNLIYYARHIMLNKQEAKPQATELSSCKGFLFVS
jgi:hypothetical protein